VSKFWWKILPQNPNEKRHLIEQKDIIRLGNLALLVRNMNYGIIYPKFKH